MKRGRISVITDIEEKSSKKYGVAVAFCGVFGLLGIHHFYLGNWLHGLFDAGLFFPFFVLLGAGLLVPAYLVLFIDAVHSIVIFYKLIVGNQRDGDGRLVTWKV